MKRTILITGAAGNLGKEVVNVLHAEGITLLATYHHHEPEESVKQKIAFSMKVNLQHEEETNSAVIQLVQQFSDLDAAVLLVGGYEGGIISETDHVAIDKQIARNFKTAWTIIKPLMAHFQKKGQGQFVLMGAKPALVPEAAKHNVAYALSKSLLFSIADIINAEGKTAGITASVVVPSTIDTPQNRESMPGADYSKWVIAADVAETIRFILSSTGRQIRQPVYKIYNKA